MTSKNPWVVQFYEPAVDRWLPRSEHPTKEAGQIALYGQQKIHKTMTFRLIRRTP